MKNAHIGGMMLIQHADIATDVMQWRKKNENHSQLAEG
tara:strand:+ start:453 stop:566 length:114 start_codon:yes stop_codon:yes gene_type:complete